MDTLSQHTIKGDKVRRYSEEQLNQAEEAIIQMLAFAKIEQPNAAQLDLARPYFEVYTNNPDLIAAASVRLRQGPVKVVQEVTAARARFIIDAEHVAAVARCAAVTGTTAVLAFQVSTGVAAANPMENGDKGTSSISAIIGDRQLTDSQTQRIKELLALLSDQDNDPNNTRILVRVDEILAEQPSPSPSPSSSPNTEVPPSITTKASDQDNNPNLSQWQQPGTDKGNVPGAFYRTNDNPEHASNISTILAGGQGQEAQDINRASTPTVGRNQDQQQITPSQVDGEATIDINPAPITTAPDAGITIPDIIPANDPEAGIEKAVKDMTRVLDSGDSKKIADVASGVQEELGDLGRLLATGEALETITIDKATKTPNTTLDRPKKSSASTDCAKGTEEIASVTQKMRGMGANLSVGKRTVKLCAVDSIKSIYGDAVKGADGRAVVRAEASKNFSDLGKAYLKEKGKKLTVGDSFRTNSLQTIRNRGGKADPNAAAPTGKSRHESGEGADFQLGGISKGAETWRTCKNPQTRNTPIHKWLRENAPKYGLGQHPGEAWHWDVSDNRCTYDYHKSNKVRQEKTRNTNKYKPLLDLIAKHESGGNYNAFHANAGNKKIKLTDMTIAEVLRWQDEKQYLKYGGKSSAAGKYQILEATLRGLVQDMKIDTDKKFNAAMQDKLAVKLLERRGLKAYLGGFMTLNKFLSNIAHEWAALPENSSGAGAYDHDGLNKALVSWGAVLKAAKTIK